MQLLKHINPVKNLYIFHDPSFAWRSSLLQRKSMNPLANALAQEKKICAAMVNTWRARFITMHSMKMGSKSIKVGVGLLVVDASLRCCLTKMPLMA